MYSKAITSSQSFHYATQFLSAIVGIFTDKLKLNTFSSNKYGVFDTEAISLKSAVRKLICTYYNLFSRQCQSMAFSNPNDDGVDFVVLLRI